MQTQETKDRWLLAQLIRNLQLGDLPPDEVRPTQEQIKELKASLAKVAK